MAKCSKFKTIQNSTMSRGCSFGGGQSSLGYLFESNDPPTPPLPPKSSSKVTNSPSNDEAKGAKGTTNAAAPTSLEETTGTIYSIYQRQGQNTENIITGRPSTRVQSAPGGNSSLGYLFGDEQATAVRRKRS